MRYLSLLIVAAHLVSTALAAPPAEWIEPATGHRVVRLSQEDGTTKLYFHQNAFTLSGDKMLLQTPGGLATVELATRKVEPLIGERASHCVVGRKSRQVYYLRDDTLCATHLDTHATRVIAKLAPEMRFSAGMAINADETLLAGSFVEPGAPRAPRPSGGKGRSLETRWAAHLPMKLFTVNVADGSMKTFHPSTEWLNHVQFSPTDPALIMFCHEGPWHKVDRIWTLHGDGTDVKKIHSRTMDMEIAGHEFFAGDGRTIWYDLQTPKSEQFWLAGYDLGSGKLTKYRVAREHWSVHYNISPDGTLFAGDGGGPNSVAAPGNGQWLYLFTPQEGKLAAEKLVDLSTHDYKLEPNVNFTPDGKWIVFQATLHGVKHVYEVEVKK